MKNELECRCEAKKGLYDKKSWGDVICKTCDVSGNIGT